MCRGIAIVGVTEGNQLLDFIAGIHVAAYDASSSYIKIFPQLRDDLSHRVLLYKELDIARKMAYPLQISYSFPVLIFRDHSHLPFSFESVIQILCDVTLRLSGC